MDTSSLMERLSETYVKPSTPTPPSLRYHKLCLNSQFEKEYIPLAFFYPVSNPSSFRDELIIRQKTAPVLETALSKTLSYYYPFAGRLRDNKYIECNDKGAHFSEVKLKFPMSHIERRENSYLKGLALAYSYVNDNDPSLLAVQVNYFECGGIALSISMNHKLGDVATLLSFYRDWASLVTDQTKQILTPMFLGPSLFPPLEDPKLLKEVKMELVMSPLKHLLFERAKLEELKNKVVSSAVVKPTRVEVVTALLYKCALEASKKVSGKFKPSGVVVTINLRPMMVPPLPNEAVGNLTVGMVIPTVTEEEVTLEKLVCKKRNEKVRVRDAYRKAAEAEAGTGTDPSVGFGMDQMNMWSSGELEIYVCSSWCRHPFYEVDFGRGKPTMVYFPDQAGGKNFFLLRDTKDDDGNIQVLASLDNQEMAEFLTNQQLLAFASIQ